MVSDFKKIAVTGSTGLLASRLIPMLEKKGYLTLPLSSQKGDYAHSDKLKNKLLECDAVIHCAGKVSYDPKESKQVYAANYHFTKFFVELAKESKIKKFIQVSSIVTFGYGKNKIELRDETSEYNARNLQLAYWNSKYESEALALSKNNKDFEVVAVNPGTILGGNPTKSLFTSFVRKMSKLPFLVVPHGGSNFVAVDDVASGCIAALEMGSSGSRYLLGSENLTYLELYQRIRKVCHKSSFGFELPEKLLRFSKNPRIRRMNGIYLFHKNEKAKRELNYHPSSIDNAIEELL